MSVTVLDDEDLIGESESEDALTRVLRQVVLVETIILLGLQILILSDALDHGVGPIAKIEWWWKRQAKRMEQRQQMATTSADELAAEVEPWLDRQRKRNS